MATEPTTNISTSSSPVEDNSGKCPVESIHKAASNLVDEEEQQVSFSDILFRRRKRPFDPDAIATKRSVFDDPILAPRYWPKMDCENIHRLDPSARWTYREERALVRKINWKIMFLAAIVFSALTLVRFNLSQANSSSFLADLGLTKDDFNLGNTVFRLAFLCAELPSELISKRLGPDRWIPTKICLLSVVSLSQFWLTDRTSFLVCRALLGVLQGGFIPEFILYLSYFYTRMELRIRLNLFWMSSYLWGITASFLAVGILHLDGVGGKAGWRWLFLIEGGITLLIGVATFFNMPPSPTQTKAWFRPKGWFTEREELIMVNRILRDDPTKGDMHNREGLIFRPLWTAMCDYDLWPLYILGLMFGIPNSPPATYLTILLRDIGFNTLQTNLLTIPYQVLGTFTMICGPSLSWSPCMLYRLGLTHGSSLVLLRAFCLSPIPTRYRWGGALVMQVVWLVVPPVPRYTTCLSRYERGNRILIIICCVNLGILYPGTKAYYIWRNRQRDKIWYRMTFEERAHYLRTTKDVGRRRLDFRFAY